VTVGISTTGRRRVLLIEDQGDTRAALSAFLTLMGHRVMEAEDGKGGLAVARRELPEVAVLDLWLPDMHGEEAIRELRALAKEKHLGIIVVTGVGGAADRRRAIQAGCDAFLLKPPDLSELEQLIATACRNGPRRAHIDDID
jgi:DNA-binding response OmpR family regulator